MAANEITKYLLLFLKREVAGIDMWRNNRADVKVRGAGGRIRSMEAGIDGQADLTGAWAPTGRRCEIEIKGPGDSQRQTQKDFQYRMERAGALYIICRVKRRETVEEIRVLLKDLSNADVPSVFEHPQEIATFFAELRAALGMPPQPVGAPSGIE